MQNIKRLIVMILLSIVVLMIYGCGKDETVGNGESITPDETIAEEVTRVENVVCPNFSLTDGFILPIEQKDTVPENWIGISSVEDFLKIGLNRNGNYILMSDLDLTEIEYEGIESFSGVFDGNGYTIENSGHNFLFKTVEDGGCVENLRISHSQQSEAASYYAGIVAGVHTHIFAGIVGWLENATLDNCYIDGDVTVLYEFADECQDIGGMVYCADRSVISNCYNSCNIKATAKRGGIGGIVHEVELYDGSEIYNCFNEGNLTSTYACSGIVKFTYENIPIYNCYNSGDLIGARCAGICGAKATISRCYNSGRMTSSIDDELVLDPDEDMDYAYGIGSGNVSNCYNAGDFFGFFNAYGIGETGSFYGCYNVGAFSSNYKDSNFGGICRASENVEYCYFLDNVESVTPKGALYANTDRYEDAKMQNSDSFLGFDFDTIWEIGKGDYPYPVFRDDCSNL